MFNFLKLTKLIRTMTKPAFDTNSISNDKNNFYANSEALQNYSNQALSGSKRPQGVNRLNIPGTPLSRLNSRDDRIKNFMRRASSRGGIQDNKNKQWFVNVNANNQKGKHI